MNSAFKAVQRILLNHHVYLGFVLCCAGLSPGQFCQAAQNEPPKVKDTEKSKPTQKAKGTQIAKDARLINEADEEDVNNRGASAAKKHKSETPEPGANWLLVGGSALILSILAGSVTFLFVLRKSREARSRSPSAFRGIRTSTQIDEYHFVQRIHDGLNSQVWEVFSESTDEHTAMKILMEDKAEDKKLRYSLRHEYDVARRLAHPNLIRFKHFVEDNFSSYIIMELFRLRNLKKRITLKQKDFLLKHAREIMKQSAKALAFMHTRGWVHRDVKPANILVADDGEVRVIDFGLAERAAGKLRRLLSRRRGAQGTISYISPEQIRGECVDDRSDIYCLGATFYEMLTGRPPFVGQSPGDLLAKHLSAPLISPQVYNPELSDEISALLRWMLDKPERRPPAMNIILLRLRETPLFRAEEAPRCSE